MKRPYKVACRPRDPPLDRQPAFSPRDEALGRHCRSRWPATTGHAQRESPIHRYVTSLRTKIALLGQIILFSAKKSNLTDHPGVPSYI